MKYLIGFNMIAFALAFFIANTFGGDLTIKEKTTAIVLIQIFVAFLSVGAFLITEG